MPALTLSRDLNVRPLKSRRPVRCKPVLDDLEARTLLATILPPGGYFPPIISLTPPPAPSLTAATATSSSQVNVSWTTSTGATDYLVVATPVPAAAGSVVQDVVAPVSSGSSESFSVTGLGACVAYSFQVEAYNEVGGNWSNAMTATTFPAAPTPKVVSVQATEVGLNWPNVPGATSFTIEATPASYNPGPVQTMTVPSSPRALSLSAVMDDLNAGSTYSFQVAAQDAAGESWSSGVTATTSMIAPSVTATATSASQINLSWNPIPGATGFNVEEEVGGKWEWASPTGFDQTSFAATGLNPNSSYSFMVAALFSINGEDWSPAQTATTFPAAPSIQTSMPVGSEFGVDWAPVAGASSYLVSVTPVSSNSGSSQTIPVIPTPGATSIGTAVTNLTAGGTYAVQVEAINPFVGGTWSTPLDVTTAPATPPLAAIVVSPTEVQLDWDAVLGANLYGIFTPPDWNYLSNTTTSDLVTGLTPGATYTFVADASNSAGWSGQSDVTVTLPPAAPSAQVTTVSSSQIDLSWAPTAGASGYEVDLVVNGLWQKVSPQGFDQTSFALTGLSPGTSYQFTVGAVGAAGTTYDGRQYGMTDPAAPAVSYVGLPTQVIPSWSAVTGAVEYVVDEFSGVTHTYLPVQVITSNGQPTYYGEVSGLSPSTTYSFKVVAIDQAGSTFSPAQSVSTIGADPAVPSGVTYSPAAGSLYGTAGVPSYTDVNQGHTGDCWLVASLAEIAARDPQDIEDMFTPVGSTYVGSSAVEVYSVRLFDNSGNAHQIVVDTEFPGGGLGDYTSTALGDNVLWVALAEKAYAEANGLGFVTTSNVGINCYGALTGGWPSWALQAFVGGTNAGNEPSDTTDLVMYWQWNDFIVLTTTTPSCSTIVDSHCYAVVGYNPTSSNPFTLYNPWGVDKTGLWAPGHDNSIYGLFATNATFISQNFDQQYYSQYYDAGTGHANRGAATGDALPGPVGTGGGPVLGAVDLDEPSATARSTDVRRDAATTAVSIRTRASATATASGRPTVRILGAALDAMATFRDRRLFTRGPGNFGTSRSIDLM